MAKAKQAKRPDPAKMGFEEATAELEAIIERIESGEIGLEESLAERRRGDALIRRSRAILEAAEQEIEQVELEKDQSAADRDEDATDD